ncbi:MAG TPA: aminotransferase class V-fold PLP-dependent enzyme [Verrucomicrobiae bacterium]|nr:aminotransferase class V-fold PLP-dependent enzyme [Verrucomicrobiae bacterium]
MFEQSNAQSLEGMPQMVGVNRERSILLDNAATTPAFAAVQETVTELLDSYGSVHRGAGENARISTEVYERSREIIGEFFGADAETDTVIFTKNTTEAINLLAQALTFDREDVIIRSVMDHHSNDLPWRHTGANVQYVEVDVDGRFDEAHFEELLVRYAGKIKLVAVSGASNVTGIMPNVASIAQQAHAADALVAVDAAQLAPHRPIDMSALGIDFLAVSAHKMYAPLGSGALIGKKRYLTGTRPPLSGGGTIKVVTDTAVSWAELPDRFEAGTPNALGAAAFAAAARVLEGVGMEKVAHHEATLTAYALGKLATIEGLQLYGDTQPEQTASRVGVLPFNLEGISHQLVAAELGYQHHISVRNGCFCAHPYVTRLLGVGQLEFAETVRSLEAGDKRSVPGMVRASFGIFSNFYDVDCLVGALRDIQENGIDISRYQQESTSGEYFLKQRPRVEEWQLPQLLRKTD